jgi:hypothetical protein
MRDGVTIIRIPEKGGKLRADNDHVQRGRDNTAKAIRFERKQKRKLKNS